MLIEYTKPNGVTFPISSEVNGVNTEVDHIRFVPGINEISKDKWSKVANQVNVKAMLNGDEETEPSLFIRSKEDDSDVEFAITKTKLADAKKIIRKTYDLDLLETWKAAETRAGILKDITNQITMVVEKTQVKKAS